MTSERKIAANKANGAKGRGPKTPAGRARSAKNASKHGFSRSGGNDVAGSDPHIARLAAQLEHDEFTSAEGVRDILTAQSVINAVNRIKAERLRSVISRIEAEPSGHRGPFEAEALAVIALLEDNRKLERYATRARRIRRQRLELP